MKKTFVKLTIAMFLLTMPVMSEARTLGETTLPELTNVTLPEFNQYTGVGRIRSNRRRQVRRRHRRQVRRQRRQMRRNARRNSRSRRGSHIH